VETVWYCAVTVMAAGITFEGQDGHGKTVAKGGDAETTVESPAASHKAVVEDFIAEENGQSNELTRQDWMKTSVGCQEDN
jgi:hypothetical protein